MSRSSVLVICFALSIGPVSATPLVIRQGTHSVISHQPVAEAYASLRLTLGSQVLVTANGLLSSAAGTVLLPDSSAIVDTLSNGLPDVFVLEMNLGQKFDDASAGGGIAFFDSGIEGVYPGDPSSLFFRIDQLIFSTSATPFGLGTQATPHYSLGVYEGAPATQQMPVFTPAGSSIATSLLFDPPVSQPTPEPSTWTSFGMGIALIALARYRYPAEK